MSKISFTISIPHEGPHHIPQFSISCNNATYLSFKGTDIANARFGNGNTVPKKGWKRLEFGVTGSRAATRLSLMVNTSAVLPPLAWTSPGPAPAASVSKGGSVARRGDLKNEAKRLEGREREDGNSRQRERRLGIEAGGKEWKERGENYHQQRMFDDKGKSKSDRGERVRRSERKRAKDVQVLEDTYVTDYEEGVEVAKGLYSDRYREERKDRVRRRERKGRFDDVAGGEVESRRSVSSRRGRDGYEGDEKEKHYRRNDNTGKIEIEPRKKVTGKNIPTKYRKSRSDSSSQRSSMIVKEMEHVLIKSGRDWDGGRGESHYYRNHGRGEGPRPADFGYEVDVVGD